MSAEQEYYISLIERLCHFSNETEWLEFKVNNDEPSLIGEYVSALSNSATICEKEKAYMIWGIDDSTHEIVGTSFSPKQTKIGNEELENWLLRALKPRVDFKFFEISINGVNVVIMEIPRANNHPTRFKETEYIRVGSYKKKLKDFPEKERKLWLSFEQKPFELMIALENITSSRVTELLDCAAYYTLMNLPLPSNRDGIIHNMLDEQFIIEMDNGNYAITNMGALLFAKNLNDFSHLKRKSIRVIQYRGTGRTNAIREQVFSKGYAVQFSDITDYVMTIIPQEEEIDGGPREEHIMFPKKAVREMVGNMIIHQDLTVHGNGPMMEVFDTRVESSNPGNLLVEVNRIIDTAPHSRNEYIASFLRIVKICEERGSGFDRMEEGMNELKIPAPKVETAEDFTRTKLYWYKNFGEWKKEDKIRTCYLYTCYCYVNEIEVSNAVLRNRFGIEEKNKAMVSRVIKETMKLGFIKLADNSAPTKMRRYIPYWA
ncbi:RNA-binding domain-containing protein [Massilicoli timonensis]|uniref:RNA-binding domain-containing protein n=1 Tax=Massilicoli timonensis TaxID=2015901 RepID=UPI000C8503E5|nr:RNA-binding domain-containing protein [Massilicoli timonensis]